MSFNQIEEMGDLSPHHALAKLVLDSKTFLFLFLFPFHLDMFEFMYLPCIIIELKICFLLMGYKKMQLFILMSMFKTDHICET